MYYLRPGICNVNKWLSSKVVPTFSPTECLSSERIDREVSRCALGPANGPRTQCSAELLSREEKLSLPCPAQREQALSTSQPA